MRRISQQGFADRDFKDAIVRFLVDLMELAYRDRFPLSIRTIEQIGQILAGAKVDGNEQVEPWASIVVSANGDVSTYSPEFMEVEYREYDSFVFGNILHGGLSDFAMSKAFQKSCADVAAGVNACRSQCRYFAICGGGSPVNKICEKGDLRATETEFCRLSIQAPADALMQFLKRRSAAPASA